MRYLSLTLISLSMMACSFASDEYDESDGAGYIDIEESEWKHTYDTTYPFTVTSGEIACSVHPVSGREVWFAPQGYTHESYIPTPINRVAVESLEEANMMSDVPYSIKEGVDLGMVVKIGLKLCDEQLQSLDSKNLF